MKRIIGLLAAGMVLITFQPAHSFDLTEQFDQKQQVSSTNLKTIGSVIVQDFMTQTNSDVGFVRVFKSFTAANGATVSATWADCLDLTDSATDQFCGKPNILKSGFSLQGVVIAPYCEKTSTAPCLKAIQVSQGGAPFVSAEFRKYSHQGRSVSGHQAESDLGLPAGFSSSLFSVDLPGWAGTYLAVKPLFLMGYGSSSAGPAKFFSKEFGLEVAPVIFKTVASARFVKMSEGSRDYSPDEEVRSWPDAFPVLAQTNIYASNFWGEDGRVARKANLPEDIRIRVVMKMPKIFPNWYFGQLENAIISTAPGIDSNTITIEADPANIQKIAFSSDLARAHAESTQSGERPFINLHLSPGNPFSISAFSESLPDSVNRSLANATAWRLGAGTSGVSSVSAGGTHSPELTKCLARFPNFGGMVTTNAPLFDSAIPKHINGYLDYQVSGLHFGPDGKTLNRGTYTLTVSSAFARCVYGLSNLPVSATVSVLGEGGETRAATTTVRESPDGILTIAAKGFTFSSPTVRVKFIQKAKATTTCVKGKVVKVLRGNSAKCPSGFKKK